MGVSSKVTTRPKTIDCYLKAIRPDQRKALEKLRQDIHAAASSAEECISYGIPSFRWKGKLLVGFGAAKTHCAFYPGSIVRDFADELSGYDTAKGTIRFQPNQPLPKKLVKKIVKARIAQRAGSK
jgi:uncharacterized protein YdhG (YjbR/CyaY superfamily)